MARKKDSPTSLFVPADEQPYPIPENWCWTYIGNCYEVTSSKRVHKEDWKDSGIPFYRTRELVKLSENGYVDNELFISNELYEKLVADYGKPKIGDVLISGVGTIGTPFIVKENTPFYFKDGNIIWFQCKGICLPKYIFYLYKSNFMHNLIHDMSAGTTVDTYTIINANRTILPLPPLTEQRRIANRIESLFAKLDEAKEKAQAVVDGVELRKSAILHKAFTGELTERWRKEHGVGLESWKIVLFNDCIQKMQNGLAKRSGSIGESYVVLRLANLSEDGFDTSNLREILLDEKEQETYSLLENDVIMIRVNGSKDNVGRQLLVPDVKKWAFCDHIIRIRYQNNILPDYMVLFSKSDNYRTYVKDHMVSSAGQNTISRKGIANMAVPVPECDEQKEIVRTLSVLFNKEQQAKEAAEVVLTQIDTMKKAILARAFRGELGTNDPAEKWAGELVKIAAGE